MTEAVAYRGVTVDHLIRECPHMARSIATRRPPPWEKYGSQLVDLVDVDGSDLCGWCVRVWKARST